MPSFGRRSLTRLSTVRPELHHLFNMVVKHRDCTVLCGVRSKAEQDRLYKIGRSTVMWPNSQHNVTNPDDLAGATDVAPFFADQTPHVIWPNTSDPRQIYAKEVGLFYNFAGYVQAVADGLGIKIRWGGDWDGDGRYSDQMFDDLVHFELRDR